jgi:hypothetical protein
MNQNTQQLVQIFNQDELNTLMIAVSGYMSMKRKGNRSTEIERVVFNKVVDALLVSNELNAVEVDRVPAGGRMGVGEYKMAEAMDMA